MTTRTTLKNHLKVTTKNRKILCDKIQSVKGNIPLTTVPIKKVQGSLPLPEHVNEVADNQTPETDDKNGSTKVSQLVKERTAKVRTKVFVDSSEPSAK